MERLVATSICVNSFVPNKTCLTSFLIRLSASCFTIIMVSALSTEEYVSSIGNHIFPLISVIVTLSVVAFPNPVATNLAIAAAFSSSKLASEASWRSTLA